MHGGHRLAFRSIRRLWTHPNPPDGAIGGPASCPDHAPMAPFGSVYPLALDSHAARWRGAGVQRRDGIPPHCAGGRHRPILYLRALELGSTRVCNRGGAAPLFAARVDGWGPPLGCPLVTWGSVWQEAPRARGAGALGLASS